MPPYNVFNLSPVWNLLILSTASFDLSPVGYSCFDMYNVATASGSILLILSLGYYTGIRNAMIFVYILGYFKWIFVGFAYMFLA